MQTTDPRRQAQPVHGAQALTLLESEVAGLTRRLRAEEAAEYNRRVSAATVAASATTAEVIAMVTGSVLALPTSLVIASQFGWGYALMAASSGLAVLAASSWSCARRRGEAGPS